MEKNKLNMKYVLVTGGAGFVGSSLVDALLANGEKVINIDNFNDYYDPAIKRKNIEQALKNTNYLLIEGDITSAETINAIFAKYPIKLIYHLAARAGVRPSLSQPLLYEKVNIQGTINLLEAAKEHKIKKFIFASSSSVYGNNKKTPFSETDTVDNPISPYAATKKAGELICYSYHHLYQLPIACLRFFTVYGPRQRPEMAIHKFIRMIKNGEKIPMYGDGSTKRDYTYIDDIVDGLLKTATADFGYEIFNLGNSDTISLKELITLLGQELGQEPVIEKLPMQAGDVELTYAEITKAQKLLGYKPTTKIANGIKKMVNWYNNER